MVEAEALKASNHPTSKFSCLTDGTQFSESTAKEPQTKNETASIPSLQDTRNNSSISCPECGCERIFNDGFRYLQDGTAVQRLRCSRCCRRFSNPKPLQKTSKQSINNSTAIDSNGQICAILEEAKNLTPMTETKTVAGTSHNTENEIKAAPQIEQLLTQLRNDGRKPGTVKNYRKSLAHLLREGANLFDPESAKAAIAKSTLKDSTKKTVAAMLDVWFDFNQIKWRPPKYSDEHEIPYIPSEAQIDLLIAALGQKTACFCQLLKETGARCGEIAELKWDSIDTEQRKVRIKAEKGSNSRILPLSAKVLEMIAKIPKNRNPERKENLFSNADDMRTCFYLQRKRISSRQASPNLMRIHFHTFRHWKATIEQHRTKDPWHVKMILGHKSIQSTETYIHLEKMMYDGEADDQFIVKVADTMDEAVRLMEVGFEFHAEVEGHKLFRKRKPYNG